MHENIRLTQFTALQSRQDRSGNEKIVENTSGSLWNLSDWGTDPLGQRVYRALQSTELRHAG